MIFMNEGPIGGFATAGIYKLMNKIKQEKIKVVLSGEGADEFLLGYLNFQIIFLMELYKKDKKSFLRELLMFNQYNNTNFNEKEFINYSKNFLTSAIFAPDASAMSDKDLLRNQKKNKITKTLNLNHQIQNYAFSLKLPKLLSFLDKCSGAHGIECRVPYLDHNLVTFLYSNDDKFKIYNGILKYPLRKWLQDNKLSFFKTKLNVSTPQREYFKKKSTFKKIIKLLNNSKLIKLNLIDYKQFKKKYIKYLKSNRLENSFFIWKVLNVDLFLKSFFSKI